MKRIITYNVNGIRSALTKNWLEWLKQSATDIICLQEIKAHPEQLDLSIFEEAGFHHFWYPAQKKGYSGVAILSKEKPKKITYGMGIEKYDFEGRFICVHFDDFSVASVYMPSGSSGDERQEFKMQWLTDFTQFIETFKQEAPNLVICGDYNICNKPIDIHNPISNANTSGFLPEERAWFDSFLSLGYIDTFRHFNPNPHQYTWWSFRANARAKNLGWRIDYNIATESLRNKLSGARILSEAKHSDHCPCVLDIDF